MSVVLLTGFGAYAEESENPSGIIAGRLDRHREDGVEIRGRVIPVATDQVPKELHDAIDEVQPDVVLVTGVTPGRSAPAVERVAINVRDFPIPDIAGLEPIDETVVEGGPDAYLSSLPIKAILARWRDEGIPGYVSNTAGTYLCNQTFYLARHLTHDRPIRAGLVHIPITPERVAVSLPPSPSVSLDVLEDAVRLAAVVATCHDGPDLRLGAGATC